VASTPMLSLEECLNPFASFAPNEYCTLICVLVPFWAVAKPVSETATFDTGTSTEA
jgi:hypothetical protein